MNYAFPRLNGVIIMYESSIIITGMPKSYNSILDIRYSYMNSHIWFFCLHTSSEENGPVWGQDDYDFHAVHTVKSFIS